MLISKVEQFENARSKLLGIAYRITSSISESEDILQEVYIRWNECNDADIKTPDAWLATVTTRLSLDFVKSAYHRRQSYKGPWLPEPLIAPEHEPETCHEVDQTVTMALMVLLDQLSASERAAYILHDLFHYDFNSIAKMIDHSPVACRQLASRSRKKIQANQKQSVDSSAQHQQIIEAFFNATRHADSEQLIKLLSDDVIFHSDGGGKAAAAYHILKGRDEVLIWMQKVLTPAFNGFEAFSHTRNIIWFNGLPGMVLWQGELAVSAFSFTIDDNGIRQIHVLRNPDKLQFFTKPSH